MAGGLEGYCSPNMRKAVFDRLYPGNTVVYEIIPIAEAFPPGHAEYDGKAVEAIRCTIIKSDGTFVEGCKEIDVVDEKYKKPVPPTPENYVKDQTKALGRALRDGGIPQKVDELRALMSWIADLDGRAPFAASGHRVDRATGEIEGSSDPDGIDSPDAGAEPTDEQVLAKRFAELPGADKQALAKHARDEHGVTNVMRAGEHAVELLAYISRMHAAAENATLEEEESF